MFQRLAFLFIGTYSAFVVGSAVVSFLSSHFRIVF